MVAATHCGQQQATDLYFDEANTIDGAAKEAENGGDQQQKEPPVLMPHVGGGHQLE